MHLETVHRLSQLVAQQTTGFADDFDAGIPPIIRFQSVDDVERIADDIEAASSGGLTATRAEMVGVFYELALNAVEHSEWAAGYYVIREGSDSTVAGIGHTVGIADCGIGIPASLRRNLDFADVLNDADAYCPCYRVTHYRHRPTASGHRTGSRHECGEKLCGQLDHRFRRRLYRSVRRRRYDYTQPGRIKPPSGYGGSSHHIRPGVSDDDDHGQLVNAIRQNSAQLRGRRRASWNQRCVTPLTTAPSP